MVESWGAHRAVLMECARLGRVRPSFGLRGEAVLHELVLRANAPGLEMRSVRFGEGPTKEIEVLGHVEAEFLGGKRYTG